jgi:hypothetical protein
MSGLCKYKDIFGKPNTGIHSYRIFNLAVMDIAQTILAGILFSWYFKWNIWITLGGLFLLGIVVHRLFCVRTTVDKFLFPEA